jgi:hypothetical protein
MRKKEEEEDEIHCDKLEFSYPALYTTSTKTHNYF